MKPLDIIEYILVAVTLFVAVREICRLVVQKDEDKRMTPTPEKAMLESIARAYDDGYTRGRREALMEAAKIADEVYEQEQQTSARRKSICNRTLLGLAMRQSGSQKKSANSPRGFNEDR